MEKPKIAISSCILGNNVRFDGNNKLNAWIVRVLAIHCELIPVCPEVAAGMSIPREPIRLVKEDGKIKIQGTNTATDHTSLMEKTSSEISAGLIGLSGIILQKNSPSCGAEKVKLYNSTGTPVSYDKASDDHRGIFAKIFINENPQVPFIDSGRFLDNQEREKFLRKVFCHARFNKLDGSIKALQDFHARYKFLIMEYSQGDMRKLGNISANSSRIDPTNTYKNYAQILFSTLNKTPTIKNNINVFEHLLGFFKHELSSEEKKIFQELIRDYKNKLIPYSVPYKMIDFLVQKHQQYYLINHYYFNPFPKNLMVTE
jgi:uncharacterized protein YbgA (DUF1722 family)/uncharacterized protein YbbK (DUF523 family)